MPRAFSEAEKREIKKGLVRTGRELFSRYGLKKTGIKDLTAGAGISQGSFYSFFSSKEELYFEILEEEEAGLKRDLLVEGLFTGKLTRRDFKAFLRKAFEIVDSSPFFQGLYREEEYQRLLRKLPEERIKNHIIRDADTLEPLIIRWRESGCFKEVDPGAVTGLLRSLFLLTLHRQEIGADSYQETIDLFIDLMAEGLIKEEGDGSD